MDVPDRVRIPRRTRQLWVRVHAKMHRNLTEHTDIVERRGRVPEGAIIHAILECADEIFREDDEPPFPSAAEGKFFVDPTNAEILQAVLMVAERLDELTEALQDVINEVNTALDPNAAAAEDGDD